LDIIRIHGEVDIIHVHANDNFGEKDEHLPLGRGNIAWEDFFNVLEKHKYRGMVVIEMTGIEDGIKSLRYINKLLKV
jgi:sugar phosphate isomerase/epimerase